MASGGLFQPSGVHVDSQKNTPSGITAKEWSRQFSETVKENDRQVLRHFVGEMKRFYGRNMDEDENYIIDVLKNLNIPINIGGCGPKVNSLKSLEALSMRDFYHTLKKLAVLYIIAPPGEPLNGGSCDGKLVTDWTDYLIRTDAPYVVLLKKTLDDLYNIFTAKMDVDDAKSFCKYISDSSFTMQDPKQLGNKEAAYRDVFKPLNEDHVIMVFNVAEQGTFSVEVTPKNSESKDPCFTNIKTRISKSILTVDNENRANRALANKFQNVPSVQNAPKMGDTTFVSTNIEATTLVKEFMNKWGHLAETIMVVAFGHGDTDGNLTFSDGSSFKQIDFINLLDSLRVEREGKYYVPRSVDIIWTQCYGYKSIPSLENDGRINAMNSSQIKCGGHNKDVSFRSWSLTDPNHEKTEFTPKYDSDGTCYDACDKDIEDLIHFLTTLKYGEECPEGVFAKRYTRDDETNNLQPGETSEITDPSQNEAKHGPDGMDSFSPEGSSQEMDIDVDQE